MHLRFTVRIPNWIIAIQAAWWLCALSNCLVNWGFGGSTQSDCSATWVFSWPFSVALSCASRGRVFERVEVGAPIAGVTVDACPLFVLWNNMDSEVAMSYPPIFSKKVQRQLRVANARQGSRPEVALAHDTVKPKTKALYGVQMERFRRMVCLLGGTQLEEFLAAEAWSALLVWALLFLQMGFDTGFSTVGDAGNFLSGLRRWLLQATLKGLTSGDPRPGIMPPLWSAFKHWRAVEPYEFRLPVPEWVNIGFIGLALESADYSMALFLTLGFHCLLRPAEICSLLFQSIVLFLDDPGVLGIVRVEDPKVKATKKQHVLIESTWVAKLVRHLLEMIGVPADKNAKVFSWSEYDVSRRWKGLMKRALLAQASLYSLGANCLDKCFTPGGLRAGGATAYYMEHQDLFRLLWRGRWQQMATLKHYLQLGAYHLGGVEVPLEAEKELSRARLVCLAYVDLL
jgi:hypothetical protein